MVTQAYKNYLRSDRWQKKRQQVFAHYGKRCYACRKAAKVLHVHHLTYERLFKERMGDLIPLCVPCHKELTRIYKRNRRRGLRRVTMEFVKAKRASNGNRTAEPGVVRNSIPNPDQALPGRTAG